MNTQLGKLSLSLVTSHRVAFLNRSSYEQWASKRREWWTFALRFWCLHWQAGEQWKHCWELSWKCVSAGTQVSSQTENSRLCSDSRVSAANSRRHFSGFKKPVNENSNCQTNYHQTHGHPAAADNNPSSPILLYKSSICWIITFRSYLSSPCRGR